MMQNRIIEKVRFTQSLARVPVLKPRIVKSVSTLKDAYPSVDGTKILDLPGGGKMKAQSITIDGGLWLPLA